MSTSSAEIATALIAGLVALAKKFLPRKQTPKPEYITRAEFHAGLDSTGDRIGASYLALADKLDAHQRDLLFAIERQGANFERRIDALESNLAVSTSAPGSTASSPPSISSTP